MNLPPLDCHAHISVDVTQQQLANLGEAVVFAMTRSPDEALEATHRWDRNIVWSCGAHPSFVASEGAVDVERFAHRASQFAVVGEVGLDRRSGNLHLQQRVLEGLLDAVSDLPVLISMHSAGCSREMVEIVSRRPRAGLIMHWFSGAPDEAQALADLGCYFSVNGATNREIIELLPLDRVLPETDFPVARKRGGRKPGDTTGVEGLIADLYQRNRSSIRIQFYKNLRRVSVESGAIDHLPDDLVKMLLLAA